MFVYLKLIEEYYIYIMEISQILQEQKTEIKQENTETSDNVSNQHAKPVQLRDIENRSVNNNCSYSNDNCYYGYYRYYCYYQSY